MTGADARLARVNARLPASVARKVAYLERRTKTSTTEVLIASIERYYATMTEGEETAADVLAQTGFIGCAKGPPALSSTYKSQLGRSLSKKV